MRIYSNPLEAVREVERDLWEMGINVHPQTMQDKAIADDPDYKTKELQAYGFQISQWSWKRDIEAAMVNYVLTGKLGEGVHESLYNLLGYIEQEIMDRVGGEPMNPGRSYLKRPEVWEQFLHDGKFAYTYSERITPQLSRLLDELKVRPDTRQGIINFHSNICPVMTSSEFESAQLTKFQDGKSLRDYANNPVQESVDLRNMGGSGRIPCSMYYQAMNRNGKLDLIYTMRSCDFLVHFPVDIALALRFQAFLASQLGLPVGMFTYFTGSLHAYQKDMVARGIF